MALLQSLKHRPFALLWLGQTASRLGDNLYRIALSWWVLQKTGSAAIMGLVLVFSFVPQLIFLLIGGVVADRFPRVRLMFGSDVIRGVLVILVAVLTALDVLEVWHILFASIVFGFVDAFFQPAYAALVPEITPQELLNSANSLTQLTWQISGLVGPALGALIVKLGGTSVAFALDAVSFFIAAACVVSMLNQHLQTKTEKPQTKVIDDLREGFQLVFQSPWLWITIVVFGLTNITLSGPLSVALPFLVKNELHADVDLLGWITSVGSLGAVAGAILMGRAKKLHHRGLIAYGSTIFGSMCLIVIGLHVSVLGVLVAAFFFGMSMTFFSLIWINTLQELIPLDKLGRVSSVDQLGSFILLPIGFGLTGLLTDRLSASTIFIVGGIISVILLALPLLHPAIRNLD